MSNTLEYNGYTATIKYSAEDKVLYGEIEGIQDLVTFESDSIERIEDEFHASLDEYLELCAEIGKNPNKSYSGTFNVRIPPRLHKMLVNRAKSEGRTLNSVVRKAIESYLER